MNICMCGAQDGYPHDALCPFPYFGRDAKRESAWMDAWREKKARTEMANKKCEKCGKEAQEKVPVMMMGPRGFRRYHVCKVCEAAEAQRVKAAQMAAKKIGSGGLPG